MTPPVKNLYADLPDSPGREDFLTLVQASGVRVERIVSNGQHSPEDFWYDQAEDEWVILLQGTATLQFQDGGAARLIQLKAGDYLAIARHIRHRVEEVSSDAVWLAVHYGPEQ